VVVAVGDTVTVAPLKLPGFQVYELPPVPVNEVGEPEQTLVELALAFTGGKGLTVIVRVAVLKQSVPKLTPVTVYVVVTEGDNVRILPLIEPGCHV